MSRSSAKNAKAPVLLSNTITVSDNVTPVCDATNVVPGADTIGSTVIAKISLTPDDVNVHLVAHAWDRYIRLVAVPYPQKYRDQFAARYGDGGGLNDLAVFVNCGRMLPRLIGDIKYKKFRGATLTSVAQAVWSYENTDLPKVATEASVAGDVNREQRVAADTSAFFRTFAAYVGTKLRSYDEDDVCDDAAAVFMENVLTLDVGSYDLDQHIAYVFEDGETIKWPDISNTIVRFPAVEVGEDGGFMISALDIVALLKFVIKTGIGMIRGTRDTRDVRGTRDAVVLTTGVGGPLLRSTGNVFDVAGIYDLLEVLGYDCDSEKRAFDKLADVVLGPDVPGWGFDDVLRGRPIDAIADVTLKHVSVPSQQTSCVYRVLRDVLSHTIFVSERALDHLTEVHEIVTVTPTTPLGEKVLQAIEFEESQTDGVLADLRRLTDVIPAIAAAVSPPKTRDDDAPFPYDVFVDNRWNHACAVKDSVAPVANLMPAEFVPQAANAGFPTTWEAWEPPSVHSKIAATAEPV